MDGIWDIFLSTPSARRATSFHVYDWLIRLISIHALREEGDLLFLLAFDCPMDFYPRPPRGGRRSSLMCISIYNDFYPRPPRGGRPNSVVPMLCAITDFYPRPPRGGRRGQMEQSRSNRRFLSTPSARRATCGRCQTAHGVDISIHALREEGDGGAATDCLGYADISIHALREEGDYYQMICPGTVEISIHALREEGDIILQAPLTGLANFYPRPPRGGRRVYKFGIVKRGYFYPRPPRGGRLWLAPADGDSSISIHALREEGDFMWCIDKFLMEAISIHALREEGDFFLTASRTLSRDFYPRPPRGGRLARGQKDDVGEIFLSTPSARRATQHGTA